jgi:hypothetical protein
MDGQKTSASTLEGSGLFCALSITDRKLSKGFGHSAVVLQRHFLRHRAA